MSPSRAVTVTFRIGRPRRYHSAGRLTVAPEDPTRGANGAPPAVAKASLLNVPSYPEIIFVVLNILRYLPHALNLIGWMSNP